MSEFLAGRLAAPAAVRAGGANLRLGLGRAVALVALFFMAVPAAIGLLVLLGLLR